MSRILNDLRYAARSFARSPGLALALWFTIALGVGSDLTIYGFVQGLIRPNAALRLGDRVVSIFGRAGHREAGPLSYTEYRAIENHGDVFEWLGAARVMPGTLTVSGQAETVSVAALTPDLAGLFHLWLKGGGVISQRLRERGFGGRVAPAGLDGLYGDRAVDLWRELPEDGLREVAGSGRDLWVLGRLRRGVSIRQAQNALAPAEMQVLPYSGVLPAMADGLARVGTLLGLAAGAVFLIACANVAAFLLGRAFARSQDLSVRVALGAGRSQLFRELLADSVVISLAGGVSGMLLAGWTANIIPALLFDQDAAHLVFALDPWRIAGLSAACVGITIGCGLLPLMAIPYDRPVTVLRRGNIGPSRAIRRLRAGLVAAQMMSCCVLVIGTAILREGFRTAVQAGAGYRLGHPILATVRARPGVEVDIGYFEDVERAARAMPGITGMVWVGRPQGSQPEWQSFRIDRQQLPLRELALDIGWFTADSLRLFEPRPKAGRMFGVADRACRVAMVNEEAAGEMFGEETVGRSVQDFSGQTAEIIGIVAGRKGQQSGRVKRPTIYYNPANQTGPAGGIALAHFRVPMATALARAELEVNVVSPGYFDATGTAVIAGERLYDPLSGGCRIGVINREAADVYFGGKGVGAAVIDDLGRRTTIVGVVRSAPPAAFQRNVDPAIYFPMSQDASPTMTLIAGVREVTGPVLTDLRRRIESVPGGAAGPVSVKTLAAQLMQTGLAPLRIATAILTACAAIALMLGVLGLFGALNDIARQRRRELALRIALGAQRWRVIREVLKEGGRLACAGTVAGMLGSLLLARFLAGITLDNRLPPLRVWLAAPVALAVAVVIASVLPARRASLVNPLAIMRDE
ncbi:MAG: FtsX-like permease family protein [Bryobacteraceae bacterium]